MNGPLPYIQRYIQCVEYIIKVSRHAPMPSPPYHPSSYSQVVMSFSLQSYFSFQPVLHDWCNKGCGMCYPVCGMTHIKERVAYVVAAGFLSHYQNGP